MAEYNHREIEPKWQQEWITDGVYRIQNDTSKPKFYALDMFPYPSGAGLHVGHPLGYIASDIVSRYMRLKGRNVLHPMGFDAFGLPAEQYAIDTGQHPAITTEKNIKTFKAQLAKIGFSYDWDREVKTCDPAYYRWTQWIFLQLFDAWYDQQADKARPISELTAQFEQNGNAGIQAICDDDTPAFTAEQWAVFSEVEKAEMLLKYRLTYLSEAMVNWCPGLGTVLANDEVKDGFSERGGYPVERKKMKQWMMRITAYADRLEKNLDKLDWSEAMKEMQRNWIGRSYGCELDFELANPLPTLPGEGKLTVFTTRPDTIFGVTYVVLAPEHDWVPALTTSDQKEAVENYVHTAKNRSERERQADVKTVSGVFTGSYAVNPFTGDQVPIWVADYVLAGYGTGVVMAVPSSDDRDYRFAKHFGLPIVCVIEGTEALADPTEKKDGNLINSGFLNGLYGAKGSEGALAAIRYAEERGFGKSKVNYRMRDAVFSRQRYWGEPVPMYFKNGIAYPVPEDQLPLELPAISEYRPTETGEPPLARASHWSWHPEQGKVVANGTPGSYPLETTTMPGWAGSSWYFLRYMDPNNSQALVDQSVANYWNSVDLYIGGTEHATGHLLYSRFWNLFLYDRGYIGHDEPFQKLVNQGMIQGVSQKMYFTGGETKDGVLFAASSNSPSFFGKDIKGFAFKTYQVFFSSDVIDHYFESEDALKKEGISNSWNVPINFVDKSLNIRDYVESQNKFTEAIFICSNGFYIYSKGGVSEDIKGQDVLKITSQNDEFNLLFVDTTAFVENSIVDNQNVFFTKPIVEKMSKSKYNVVNPDDIIEKYGADTLRMYEMFLGPLEQSKPWSTDGIEGVSKFLKKLWRLFYDDKGKWLVTDAAATPEELKILHKTIKKVGADIEALSFNTSVPAFMVCVNELASLKSSKRAILEPYLIILSPFAPHIAEELWHQLGHTDSILNAAFPAFNEEYLVESVFTYPISINGKVRGQITLPVDMPKEDVEQQALASDIVQKHLEGKPPKKVIVVPNRIVNVVV